MIEKAAVHKPNTTPILFINWTEEAYNVVWDGKVEAKLAPGEKFWLPFWLANHAAKHLVDRELNRLGLPTDHFSRETYVAKCIGNLSDAETKETNDDPLGIKALNANRQIEKPEEPKEEVEKPKVSRKKKVTEEDTFEGK